MVFGFSKNDRFFELFNQAAENIHRGAELMVELCQSENRQTEIAGAIREIEHKGDKITRELQRLLVRSFVTPLDREDIHAIASSMDDVLDAIDDAANLYVLLKINKPIAEYLNQAKILSQATKVLVEATENLRDVKSRQRIPPLVHRIYDLESQGDSAYNHALASLFNNNPDAVTIQKWKLLCDDLEQALDACQGVGNIFEMVALKSA